MGALSDLEAISAGLLLRALGGFAAGAIVGSFLATVLLRWPKGQSALGGRSRCDSCLAPLGPAELVPILSYLVLRGRCRRCGGAVDPRHFRIELVAGLIGLVSLLVDPGSIGIVTLLFGCWLLILAALDLEHQWLPDRLTLPLIAAGLLAAILGIGPDVESRLIGAAAGFLLLAGIAALYRRLRGREGLGGGDPKLLAAIGAWLGWQPLPLVLLGAGLVGLAAAALLRLKGSEVSSTTRLPLGTLMALPAWPLWIVAAAPAS